MSRFSPRIVDQPYSPLADALSGLTQGFQTGYGLSEAMRERKEREEWREEKRVNERNELDEAMREQGSVPEQIGVTGPQQIETPEPYSPSGPGIGIRGGQSGEIGLNPDVGMPETPSVAGSFDVKTGQFRRVLPGRVMGIVQGEGQRRGTPGWTEKPSAAKSPAQRSQFIRGNGYEQVDELTPAFREREERERGEASSAAEFDRRAEVNQRNAMQRIGAQQQGRGTSQGRAPLPPKVGNPTESERKAAFFLPSVEDAVTRLEAFQPTEQSFMQNVPWVGNYFIDDDTQSALQAAEVLHDAYLRLTTGATISPKELEQAARQYVPLPGDKPGVVAFKAQRRRQIVEAMRHAARRAMPTEQEAPPMDRSVRDYEAEDGLEPLP